MDEFPIVGGLGFESRVVVVGISGGLFFSLFFFYFFIFYPSLCLSALDGRLPWYVKGKSPLLCLPCRILSTGWLPEVFSGGIGPFPRADMGMDIRDVEE